jgi:prepilin-type N-terminal cleavage/methylation domain-containing protein
MIKRIARKMSNHGFTLIEVIVTIIAAAILGAIFINFMGTAMSRSTRSLENVQGEADAESVLEKIVADYVEKINLNESSALTEMNTAINVNGAYNNSEKKVTVTAAYITFNNSGNESADTGGLNRTLKVTVNANEHRLTTLLTRSRSSDSPPVAF